MESVLIATGELLTTAIVKIVFFAWAIGIMIKAMKSPDLT